jgi:hypothetical protein
MGRASSSAALAGVSSLHIMNVTVRGFPFWELVYLDAVDALRLEEGLSIPSH